VQALALVLLLVLAGCSHDVAWLGEEPPEIPPVDPRVPLTVAVTLGAFDQTRLEGPGVVERFARGLREAEIFEGVMFPVPLGATPTWELRLAASDRAFEPDSNFWKSALAVALFPFAFVVHLENDYTLELEALLVRRREVLASYVATARIRHRYKYYADRVTMSAEGFELAVGGASRRILSALSRDAERLRRDVNE
jgi:hypothetical protein